MFLLYADESGSAHDPRHRYFVLGGVSVFERQSWWLSQQMDTLAAEMLPAEPGALEFHGNHIFHGKGLGRLFRPPDRIECFRKALGLLTRTTKVFAVAVAKDSVEQQDVVRFAFEQLCSRFDQYLGRLHKSGNTQRGIIVFDRSTYETPLQGLASDFRNTGHSWGVLRNLAEVPLFLDSRASRLVQMADLVSYSVFRHFEKGDSQFFVQVEPHLDRQGRIVHGLYHLPSPLSGPKD